MKRTLSLLLVFGILTNICFALPPRQHLARGTVVEIRGNEVVLALEKGAKDAPVVFAIKDGRTRWRENRRESSRASLQPGQTVRLYYRKEMGVWTATEISWTSVAPQDSRSR